MVSTIDEISPNVFRIANYAGPNGMTFAQFLIRDESPLLFHTGSKRIFEETLQAVGSLIDVASLRYVSWSHLESDECGALNDFLRQAPGAEPVQCAVGARYGADFFDKPVRALADGEVLELGDKRLRLMATPHVPHSWDAVVAYEETTGVLFASDLFTMRGEQPAATDHDIIEASMEVLRASPDYLPVGPHVTRTFARLEALSPRVLAGHHAPAYTGDGVKALQDLRGELFRLHG